MNNEQLTAYLKDESYLYTLSYEELKTLVVQYPYATNLRVLLLKKSYIEQNKDYERNLQMAAAYSTNRRFLYKLVKKLKTLQNVPENVILGEDYLELTELSNIEKMLEGRHVSEIYNDNTVALSSDLQLDWGGVEFGSSIESNDIEEDNSVIIDLTMPLQSNISTESPLESNQNYDEKEVELAIEHILSEFGASALDFTAVNGISDLADKHLTTLEDFQYRDEEYEEDERVVLKDTSPLIPTLEALFESEQIDDEESPNDDFEDVFANGDMLDKDDNPKEIPHPTEPFDFENLDDIKEIPDTQEPENQIIDEEIKHFEELDEKGEFIENQFIVEKKQDNQDANWQVLEPIFDNPNALSFGTNDIVNRAEPTSPHLSIEEYNDEKIADVSHLEVENMKKKSDVEMEIVNDGKTIVIDNNPPVKNPEPIKLSFSEWLRQFKMTSPENIATTNSSKETASTTIPVVPTQNIDNKTFTPTHISTDNKHVLSESVLALMFEKPQDLPENLFGLNNPSSNKNEDYFAENPDELYEDDMPKKKKKKKQMHELAAKSIEENDDMISETLADILAWQGNYKKSIEMYKRLCLLIPEKSDYFAAKIEKLRNTDL